MKSSYTHLRSFLRRHVASLQRESADPPPRDAVAIAGEHYKSSGNSDGQKLQHGKQARGRNKKRPRDSNDDTLKICHATLQGSVCSYGERCKWNHDLAGYMKHREKVCFLCCLLHSNQQQLPSSSFIFLFRISVICVCSLISMDSVDSEQPAVLALRMSTLKLV
jgi:hypothetical protein